MVAQPYLIRTHIRLCGSDARRHGDFQEMIRHVNPIFRRARMVTARCGAADRTIARPNQRLECSFFRPVDIPAAVDRDHTLRFVSIDARFLPSNSSCPISYRTTVKTETSSLLPLTTMRPSSLTPLVSARLAAVPAPINRETPRFLDSPSRRAARLTASPSAE